MMPTTSSRTLSLYRATESPGTVSAVGFLSMAIFIPR